MRDYKQFFAICKAHGFDYKDKVAEFTDGRTDSLRGLSDEEWVALERRMLSLNAPFRKRTFKPRPGDAQRKKMLSIARQMGWVRDGRTDVSRVNDWCLSQKYKKGLNELTMVELNTLLYIFETKVLASYYEGFK